MENLAKKTREYLEKYCKELNLHLITRFPYNSCESTSLLLGKILAEEFPDEQVMFVKGTNTLKHEMHNWIEVGDFAFDITADQFENITSPVFGVLPQNIASRFNSLKKIPIGEALKTNDFATSRSDELEIISKKIRQKT